MIEIKNVDFRYANSDTGALNDFSLTVDKGEVVLLCGESGCGKTTVTRLINGLIPHFYEGELNGSITVGGVDAVKAELYESAHIVGSVFQNPRSQFFCVDTTSEIAFACENMGLPEATVKTRIHEASRDMEAQSLFGRSIFKLSGGEKQKIACASVSAAHPEVFVLDEPTSNLDMDAIESLRRTILLWKACGKTVVIAEHRLHWLREVCDRVIYMSGGRIKLDLPMGEFAVLPTEKLHSLGLRPLSLESLKNEAPPAISGDTLELRNFCFSYDGKKQALDIKSLVLPRNGVIAVIGGNGAGKSTFLKCLCGLERKFGGKMLIDGTSCARRTLLKKSYMVMQDVNHQLFCESVEDEVRLGMSEDNENDVRGILNQLDLLPYVDRHPVSMSGGQKQRVAIASALLAEKEILIFDEPTSGLDYRHMKETAALFKSLLGKRTLFVITHDPELILSCCTHVLKMANGKADEFYTLDDSGAQRLIRFFTNNEKEEKNIEKAV